MRPVATNLAWVTCRRQVVLLTTPNNRPTFRSLQRFGGNQSTSVDRRFGVGVDAAVIAAITALAIWLRLGPLDPPSLWLDDAWAALVVRAHSLHDVLLVGVTAPGFAMILKGWLSVAGFSELNAQLPAFVAGVLTPPALFVVLRRRGVGRMAAAVGALVLVASVVYMTYATRVKQYTLDSLVVLILLGVSWWLADDVASRRRWWLYALACVAAMALSSPAIVIVASSTSVALVLLARCGLRSLKIAVGPAAVIAVFTLLWWWFLLRPRINAPLRDYWSGFFIPYNRGLAHAVFVVARDVKDLFLGAIPLPTTVAAALAVPAAVAFLLVRRRMVPAFLLVIGPVAVAVLLAAIRAAPLGTGRTDIYLYPGLAMGIAVAVDELVKWSPSIATVGAAAVVVVAAVTFNSIIPYPKRDIGPLVGTLNHSAEPGDSVIVRSNEDYALALYTTWPVTFFSFQDMPGFVARIDHDNVILPELVQRPLPGLDVESWSAAIARAAKSSTRVWLLAAAPAAVGEATPRLPQVRSLLRHDGFVLTSELPERGADLTLWSSSGSRVPNARPAP